MNNMHQLVLAATMYSGDNNEWIIPNPDGNHMGQPSQETRATYQVSWAGGILDWTTVSVGTANTNLQYLTDAAHYALIAPYVANNYKIFWCPTDYYLAPVQRARGWANRVR